MDNNLFEVNELNEQEIEITGYNGHYGDVHIPNEIDGKKVVDIGNIFTGCSKITSITIPYGVTHIAPDAFKGCSRLKSISIPNSVTRISDGAFEGCKELRNITIPNSINDEISMYTFRECSSLKSVSIPDGINGIGFCAFWGCIELKDITIPESVKYIREGAFRGCVKLKKITYNGTMNNWLEIFADKIYDLTVTCSDGTINYH